MQFLEIFLISTTLLGIWGVFDNELKVISSKQPFEGDRLAEQSHAELRKLYEEGLIDEEWDLADLINNPELQHLDPKNLCMLLYSKAYPEKVYKANFSSTLYCFNESTKYIGINQLNDDNEEVQVRTSLCICETRFIKNIQCLKSDSTEEQPKPLRDMLMIVKKKEETSFFVCDLVQVPECASRFETLAIDYWEFEFQ